MVTWLLTFISLLFQILTLAIVARAFLSWVPLRPDHPVAVVLTDITEPILAPLRQVIPRIGMIDITPLVAIILLQVIEQILRSSLLALY
jgi:YggT family protein